MGQRPIERENIMTFNYRLFQAPRSCGYAYMSFEYAMTHDFKGSDYVSVWAGDVEAETIGQALERIFRIHNADDRPNGRGMCSLSMSHVVELDGVPYYCDRFGWSEVDMKVWYRR